MLDLARNRPNLFHLLYLSDGFQGNRLLDVMMTFESNQKMVSRMAERYCLEERKCKDILLRSCLLLMGISTMIYNNHMALSNEQAADMMKRTVLDMVNGAGGARA